MSSSEDLHPLLKQLNDLLKDLQSSIQKLTGEIKKLISIVETGFEAVQKAIEESTRAQAELTLIERMAEVESLKPRLEAEREAIEEEKEELDARLDQLDDRYQGKHEELQAKTTDRIRDLGSHIFTIMEDEYEEGIERPFARNVTATWDALRQHDIKVYEDRSGRLENPLHDVQEAVDRFLERRRRLLAEIEEQRVRFDEGLDGPMVLELPYWVVEVEAGGGRERVVVPPSEIEGAGPDGVELTPLPGTKALLEEEGPRIPEDPAFDRLEGDDLAEALAATHDDRTAGLVKAREATKGVLPSDGITLATEGGHTWR